MSQKICLTVFTALGFLLFLTPSYAATVSVVGGVITYTADVGEENMLTVSADRDEWTFEELAVNITSPSADCVGSGTKVLVCEPASVSSVNIILGDEDDEIWLESFEEQVSVDLGNGNDEITWTMENGESEEDGFLVGGAGDDKITIKGSSIDDKFVIDESGRDVRIYRNLPLPEIRLDIEEVEDFEIDTENGNDSVTFTADIEDINDIEDMTFVLKGGSGNDTFDASLIEKDWFAVDYAIKMYGEDGADYLIGSQDKDILECGDGIDRYKDNGGPDQVDDDCKDTTVTQAFSDVSGHKFLYYISDLYYDNIVSGYSDGRFYPDRHVSRDQMSKFIVNAFELPIKTNCAAFPDVPSSNQFYSYIMTLKCNGIVSGYSDGTYKPGNFVTRGEVTKFVVETMKYREMEITLLSSSFPDVTSTNPFSGYIGYLTSQKVNDEQIIGGYSDGTYKPSSLLDRGQMSKIISNSRALWKQSN